MAHEAYTPAACSAKGAAAAATELCALLVCAAWVAYTADCEDRSAIVDEAPFPTVRCHLHSMAADSSLALLRFLAEGTRCKAPLLRLC